MKRISFILTIFFKLSSLLSQPIPNHYFVHKSKKLLFDAGSNWETLTTFGPIRYKIEKEGQTLNHKSTFRVKGSLGLLNENNLFSLDGFSIFNFKDIYFYMNPKYINQTKDFNLNNQLTNLSNVPENISGIGYENSWTILQVGRGTENWGAGNDIQLALGSNSSSYDYFLLASDYGKIRVRYIHGFLENIKENINRYITARGLEWTNRKSLIIGFSETVIYSGENRSLDLGYMNPLASHLEVELNNRLNIAGAENSNAVWQLHLDYFFSKRFRLSGNYLFDEFVLDPKIQRGKEHGKAYSIRLAYTPNFSNRYLLTIYSSIIHIGTPTFRHGMGTNNFVNQERPLGWFKGSDGEEVRIGLNYFNKNNLIASISSGYFKSGEESITFRPYEPYKDYLKGPFPSGKIDETIFIDTYFSYSWKKYLFFTLGLNRHKSNGNNPGFDLMYSLNLFHTFSYK